MIKKPVLTSYSGKLDQIYRKRNIILIVTGICLSFLLLPYSGVITTSDSGRYLHQALRMYQGNPLDSFERGPGFPWLLTQSFHMLGPSVQNAFFIVRLSLTLLMIMTFVWSRSCFGNTSSFLTLAFLMSSYGVNSTAGYLLLDITVALFFLLSLLLGYYCLRNPNLWRALLTGLVIGLSCLIKEVLIVAAPVPFLGLVFSKQLKKKHRKWTCFLAMLAGMIVPIASWVLYIYHSGGNISNIFGNALPYLQSMTQGYSMKSESQISLQPWNALLNLQLYYQNHIRVATGVFAPWIIISFFIFIIRSIKYKNISERYIVMCVAICLPLMAAVGGAGTRLGQSIFIIVLGYLMLARIITLTISRFIPPQMTITNFLCKFFIFLLIYYLQLNQSDLPSKNIILNQTSFHNTFYRNHIFEIKGRYNHDVKKAALWIINNIPKTTRIISDGYIDEALLFFTRLDFPILSALQNLTQSHLKPTPQQLSSFDKTRLIALYPHHNFGHTTKRFRQIYWISEILFLKRLQESLSPYIVLYNKNTYLSHYLSNLHWAERVFYNSSVSIYSIDRSQIQTSPQWKPLISNEFERILVWYNKDFPSEYSYLHNALEDLSLSEQDLIDNNYRSQILDWIHDFIPKNSRIVYFHRDYDYIKNIGDYQTTEVFRYTLQGFDPHDNPFEYILIEENGQENSYSDLFPKNQGDFSSLTPLKHFPYIFRVGNGLSIYPGSHYKSKTINEKFGHNSEEMLPQ